MMGVHFHWYDAAGMLGVLAILRAYYLLQAGRVHGHAWSYQLMNAFGAAAVLVSLWYAFNLSAFVMELAWLAVSIYGMIKARRRRT